jgi:hypothetical protein
MVLLKTTLTGLVLIVLGVMMLTVLGQYVPMELQQITRHDVEPHAQFLVGDVADRSYSLPGSVTVVGRIDVAQAPSNQSADVHFMVLDNENYQKWSLGSQSDIIYSSNQPGQSNFTFSTGKGGVYHFVFDNRASLFKKYVALTIAYNEISIARVPDPRVGYVGWVLVVTGGVALLYGLIRRAPVTWA